MTGFAPTVSQLEVQAAELIHSAHNLVALTGAGISTPSGIPDFRSTGTGLWDRYDPMEVASLTAFRTHPERFYEWMRPLARQMMGAQPNPAHLALAQLEQAGILHAIVTQNIDGLHQQAGSHNVHELHGAIATLTCTNCFQQYHLEECCIELYVKDGLIPRCPSCGHILKPDVILMGEQLPFTIFKASERAIRAADLLLVVGSSLEVMPVAGLPMKALDAGAKLVIINHTPTYVDERADVVLAADAAETLPRIVDLVLHG